MRFIIWHSKLQAEGNDVAMACWKIDFKDTLVMFGNAAAAAFPKNLNFFFAKM
jgi:hypothetical protein